MVVVVVAAYGVVDKIDSEEDDGRIVGDDDYFPLPYILLFVLCL